MSCKKKEEWVTGPEGTNFFTHSWSPSQDIEPLAYLLLHHGFMDHIMRYDGFASTLASQHSISVYGFDQRGFGRTAKPSSQGVTSLPQALDDLDFFLKKCRNRAGPTKPLFLLGQSNGGQQSLIYSCTRLQSSLLAGVIAASPMIDQAPESKANKLAVAAGALAAHLLPKFKLNVGVTPEDISRDAEVVKAYKNDPLCKPVGSLRGLADMLNEGPKLNSTYYSAFPPDLPLLLWHGNADKVTSYEASRKFVEQCPAKDKEFKTWEGCYHECQHEIGDVKVQVAEYLAAWIEKRSGKSIASLNARL